MKQIYIFAAIAIALSACDNKVDEPMASNVPAHITATIGDTPLSRASNDSWTANDRIGITAITGKSVEPFINMEYTTSDNSGKFEGNPIYIHNPMDLTAYYPFAGSEGVAPGADGVISLHITPDYQTEDRKPEIDFLFAKLENITTDNPEVSFTFTHRMSKLTLVFKEGNDGTKVSKISSYKIEGLAWEGTFDTTTGICQTTGDAEAFEMQASGVRHESALPSLILFPQSADKDTVKLTITDNEDQVYVCYLNFTGNQISAGNHYQFTVTVSKIGLKVEPIKIANWIDNDLESAAISA